MNNEDRTVSTIVQVSKDSQSDYNCYTREETKLLVHTESTKINEPTQQKIPTQEQTWSYEETYTLIMGSFDPRNFPKVRNKSNKDSNPQFSELRKNQKQIINKSDKPNINKKTTRTELFEVLNIKLVNT